MRIMLDTNILISIIVFKSDKLSRILNYICHYNRLVLSTFVLDELEYIIIKKFRNKIQDYYFFINTIPYEVEYTASQIPERINFDIRDENDIPVIYSAIKADVDILVTGDKDFENVQIEKPVIMSTNEFYDKYIAV